MSRHAMRHPERYEVRIDSPFESMIPTKMGCLKCGAELNKFLDCENCIADEAHEAHRKVERKR